MASMPAFSEFVRMIKKLTFWGLDEHDDSLPRAVIAGRKTVTSDLVDSYYAGYGELGEGGYAEGDLIRVHDLKGHSRCLIRATKVERIRFDTIPEAVWRGETFSSADEYRQVHIDCMPEHALRDDTEFIALHFELVGTE